MNETSKTSNTMGYSIPLTSSEFPSVTPLVPGLLEEGEVGKTVKDFVETVYGLTRFGKHGIPLLLSKETRQVAGTVYKMIGTGDLKLGFSSDDSFLVLPSRRTPNLLGAYTRALEYLTGKELAAVGRVRKRLVSFVTERTTVLGPFLERIMKTCHDLADFKARLLYVTEWGLTNSSSELSYGSYVLDVDGVTLTGRIDTVSSDASSLFWDLNTKQRELCEDLERLFLSPGISETDARNSTIRFQLRTARLCRNLDELYHMTLAFQDDRTILFGPDGNDVSPTMDLFDVRPGENSEDVRKLMDATILDLAKAGFPNVRKRKTPDGTEVVRSSLIHATVERLRGQGHRVSIRRYGVEDNVAQK